jgi:hypothetical protein
MIQASHITLQQWFFRLLSMHDQQSKQLLTSVLNSENQFFCFPIFQASGSSLESDRDADLWALLCELASLDVWARPCSSGRTVLEAPQSVRVRSVGSSLPFRLVAYATLE